MKILSKRQFARIVANLDGKYAGLSQADAEWCLTLALDMDVACRIARMKSPLHMLKGKSIKKTKAFKAKVRR